MLAEIEFDRERMAAAASDELIAATDVADLLVRAGRAVPRGARDRRRASCGRRVERGKRLSELTDEELRRARARSSSRRTSGRCSSRARGSSRRSPRAAPRSRACATSWRRRATCWRRRRREARPRLLRALGARRGARPDRLRRPPRRDGRAGSWRPRATTWTSRPATPTSASPPRTQHPVRPARARLRLLLLRHPLAAERGLRGRGRRGGGADPRARAGRRASTSCARAAACERAEDLCSGPGKLTQALEIGLSLNGSSLVDGPIEVLERESASRASWSASGSGSPRRPTCPGASATPTARTCRALAGADARGLPRLGRRRARRDAAARAAAAAGRLGRGGDRLGRGGRLGGVVWRSRAPGRRRLPWLRRPGRRPGPAGPSRPAARCPRGPRSGRSSASAAWSSCRSVSSSLLVLGGAARVAHARSRRS